MAHQSELIEHDILAYLRSQETKSLLRFITCGSVDDGKSTLIGRLLYESKLIYDDQLASLKSDSKKVGTQGEAIDFALLVDGLASEREQGITIDVAYRYFSTDKRKFIVADTPGHEQYTRNMATGASTAELAILMVDARHGIMTQTRRHSKIVQLLGVKTIVLAINKMDLVGYDESIFNQIVSEYHEFSSHIGLNAVTAIPLSALNGDNITTSSAAMPWYTGPTLMTHLETVSCHEATDEGAFSMPVQWVNRPNLDFRGFAGQITTGRIQVGDMIRVLPKNTTSTIQSIESFDGPMTSAITGQSITVTLNDEIDVSRGDVMVSEGRQVMVSRRFKSTLLWMSDTALVPGKGYWIKTRAKLLSGVIGAPDHKLDINTLKKCPTDTLHLNDIGECLCEFDQDIAYEPYAKNPHLGSFIIIDRETNHTVGMGLILSEVTGETWADHYVEMRRKHWRHGAVDVSARAKKNGHSPLMIILTGDLARSDYYTVGAGIEADLFDRGHQVYRYGYQFMRSATLTGESAKEARQDMVRKLMDMGYAFLQAGMIFIAVIPDITADEHREMSVVLAPFKPLVLNLDAPSITDHHRARYVATIESELAQTSHEAT
ncbi:MAG: sulfate adenylyltransferase subunit CysN [Candidatus Marinamargulisbacteria bacterium]